MKKALIAATVTALVSNGVMARTQRPPSDEPPISARVDTLEANVAKIGVPYTVYDQTGRIVGTTNNGMAVFFEIEGVEGITYVISAGKELPTDRGAPFVFEEADCAGPRYIQSNFIENNGARMDGVGYSEYVQNNPEGEHIIPNPSVEPITISAVSFLNYNSSTDVWLCNTLTGELGPTVVTYPLPINIDWVTPLTTIPPD